MWKGTHALADDSSLMEDGAGLAGGMMELPSWGIQTLDNGEPLIRL